MDKKNLVFLIVLMALLVVCIALMGVSLLINDAVFGQVSGYIAIACIVITLVGVLIVIRSDKHNKE